MRKRSNGFYFVLDRKALLCILIISLLVIIFAICFFLRQEAGQPEMLPAPAPLRDEPQQTVILYFASPDRKYLVPQERRVRQNANPYRVAMQELLKGPAAGSGLLPTIPPEVKLYDVFVKDNLVLVDFNAELATAVATDDRAAELMIYSVVNTLTSFAEIDAVQILIEGVAPEPNNQQLNLFKPLSRNEVLIKK